MEAAAPQGEAPVRVAEMSATLCLATDLAMGFPWEHGFQATALAMRLCDALDADVETRQGAYYATTLLYAGCNADAPDAAAIFDAPISPHIVPAIWGSRREQFQGVLGALPNPEADLPMTVRQVVTGLPKAARRYSRQQRGLCEIAQMLADRLGLPPELHTMFFHMTDRWDGSGVLGRGRGDETPLAIRIAILARDATYQEVINGREQAREVVRSRGGHAFDPSIVALLTEEVFSAPERGESAWVAVLAAEPEPHLWVDAAGHDRALAGIGAFGDFVSPSFAGHSAGVSQLAHAAAQVMGMSEDEATLVRRAGLVQDVGRVTVPPKTWTLAHAPTGDAWEQLRLHPYYSTRMLEPSPALAPLAQIAGCHHERLDGSGYHRGVPGAMLPEPARLLAAADEFRSLTEPRSYRPARTTTAAADVLAEMASDQRLDADAVEAVLHAAGQHARAIERPGGLTRREAEVLGLVARGLQTKQIGRALGIATKTADRHVQNVYQKLGVSTRAAATLRAVESGVVPWGEFPMSDRTARS